MNFLEDYKERRKNMKGRGVVEISTKDPKKEKAKDDKNKDDGIRNKSKYKAHKALAQSRRCEQVAHRLDRGKRVGDDLKKEVCGHE